MNNKRYLAVILAIIPFLAIGLFKLQSRFTQSASYENKAAQDFAQADQLIKSPTASYAYANKAKYVSNFWKIEPESSVPARAGKYYAANEMSKAKMLDIAEQAGQFGWLTYEGQKPTKTNLVGSSSYSDFLSSVQLQKPNTKKREYLYLQYSSEPQTNDLSLKNPRKFSVPANFRMEVQIYVYESDFR